MHVISLPRPHWKTASAVLLVGAVLFASNAAHADPRHGGRDRDGRGNYYNHGHYGSHHGGGYDRYRAPNRSSFSLNINSGYGGYYNRPYYGRSYPYYPATYYAPAPAPVIFAPSPVYYNTSPITYTTPPAPTNNGRYCREYTKQVWVGGRMQESYGQACMQPDGAWEIDS